MNSMEQTPTALLACVSHYLFSPNTWKMMETYSVIVKWFHVWFLHLNYGMTSHYTSTNICDLIYGVYI